MSKINEIQNAIRELEGGIFQKLADSYLVKKGYKNINSIGSVIGNNKTKTGTPDTLIINSDSYTLVEYTTKSDGIYQKFHKDIEKCFDESKTGIPISKIHNIILCYTFQLSPKEIEKLKEVGNKKNINVELYGIHTLSYDIYHYYPILSKDYLGLALDTGQILPVDDFLKLYEVNRITTSLHTNFYSREKEKKELLQAIEDNNLVIISGKAGVGKSRLAIEAYREFIKNNDSYLNYCIYDKGEPLFDDIKTYFSDKKNYLVFIDDANRLNINKLKSILHYLYQTNNNEKCFKIIITVRDYALEEIQELCKPYSGSTQVTLQEFSNDEIEGFIKAEFNIHHHFNLEQIIRIAKGNPRIAVMIAEVVKNNTINKETTIEDIYDTYYALVKNELRILSNKNALIVAGTIAFFRISDNDLIIKSAEIIGISVDEYWDISKKLHKIEVIDIFEDNIIKFSDQVLESYLFHLVFFKEKLLDIEIIIDNFFPDYSQKIDEAIHSLLPHFNFDQIKTTLEVPINKKWEYLEENEPANFLKFIDIFYFLKPLDTLSVIRNKINKLDSEIIPIDDIEFKSSFSSDIPKYISNTLVRKLSFFDKNLKASIELLFLYLEKRQKHTPEIIYILKHEYYFTTNSYLREYIIQHTIIDEVIKRSDNGENKYFSFLFTHIADLYLYIQTSISRLVDKFNYIHTKFNLSKTESLNNLRKKIFNHLFSLYGNNLYKELILKKIKKHIESEHFIEEDINFINNFFEENLNSSKLFHCIIVHDYIYQIRKLNLSINNKNCEKLQQNFVSPIYNIYSILVYKVPKFKDNENISERNKKISQITYLFSQDDYHNCLFELTAIFISESSNRWKIERGINSLFQELAERDKYLGKIVLEKCLQESFFLNNYNPHKFIEVLFLLYEPSKLLNILATINHQVKDKWLFSFYTYLPKEKIKKQDIDEVIKLFNTCEYNNIISNIDFLLKFEDIQNGFIIEIITILVERNRNNLDFGEILENIIVQLKQEKMLDLLFLSNVTVLENAYFALDDHHDYDGEILSKIMDNNSMYIERYLEFKLDNSSLDESNKYLFIWLRNDHIEIIKNIFNLVIQDKYKNIYSPSYEVFFTITKDHKKYKKIIEKQNSFLEMEIDTCFSNRKYMNVLFTIIATFEIERRIQFFELFLKKNKEVNNFKKIRLKSQKLDGLIDVKKKKYMLIEEKDFYQAILDLPVCDSIDYLEHKQYLQRKINSLEHEIQEEKIKGFIDNY